MAQSVLAISYFKYHRVQENGTNVYHFHFMGPFKGLYVREIAITSPRRLTFHPKTIYLLHLENPKIIENTLWAQLLSHKEIEDCRQI